MWTTTETRQQHSITFLSRQEILQIQIGITHSVVYPDPVGSETFNRIRIRKESFRIRAAPDPKWIGVKLHWKTGKILHFLNNNVNARHNEQPISLTRQVYKVKFMSRILEQIYVRSETVSGFRSGSEINWKKGSEYEKNHSGSDCTNPTLYTNGSTQFHIIHTVLQKYNILYACLVLEKKYRSGCVGVAVRPQMYRYRI